MTLAAAAHAYAELGWRVFPLAPRSKAPLVPRRRGGRGFQDATTDHDQIAAWWNRCPMANIGIATGEPFFVVDVDPRNGGDDELAELEHMRGALPHTVEACTGGGGRHLLFSGEAGCAVLVEGVDIKGAGGYIVAAPSIHPDTGRPYLWEASSRPGEVPIAPAPAWLLDAIGSPKRARRYFEHSELVDPTSFVLGAAFSAAGWLGRQIRPGVWAVLCPNRAQHSTGRDFDTSTVIFAPPPGYRRGRFYCSHAHCSEVWR